MTNEYINISWNSKSISLRKGSKVRDLLSQDEYDLCLEGKAFILDSEGNEYGLDGSLGPGLKLFLKSLKEKNI